VGHFLWVVDCDRVSAVHRYKYMAPRTQRRQDLDLLGSRDVIGHVTIRLPMGYFLWVVCCDHAFILSFWRYKA